tara:strand:+ start:1896 stop:2177 length:282 start_codon:yes stop_codon:yes gene_type:complete
MARRRRSRQQREREDACVEELHAFLDLLDAVWEDEGYTFKEMSDRSGLAPTTLHNLWHRKTRFPRFMTIQKLSAALGFSIEMNQGRRRVRIAA